MSSRRNNTAVLYMSMSIVIACLCYMYYARNGGYSPGAGLVRHWTGTRTSADVPPQFDPNGYVIFCLCMGNIGNQFDQFLGAVAFAKKLNRTIVVPTISSSHVPFTDWFKLEPLLDYHRAILGSDFMRYIAPVHWPQGQRFGFCAQQDCNLTHLSGKFKSFWDDLGVKFDGSVSFKPRHSDARDVWEQAYSPDKYPWPVLAFHAAPGNYPMRAEDRHLQKVLVFSDRIQQETRAFIDKLFPAGEKFIAIHLRNGADWEVTCERAVGPNYAYYMSSSQCLGQGGGTITQEICLPPKEEIIRLTTQAVVATGIKVVYEATDYLPMVEDLQDALQQYNVTVLWRTPRLPIIDLAIMSMSDHFIGNCVSSFTAFVKRARDVTGKPTSFWGRPFVQA